MLGSATHDRGVPRGRAFLATHARSPVRAGTDRIIAGDRHVDLEQLLTTLQHRGVRSVLCEGGPHLLTSMLSAGLVDEIAVTTAPLLVGSTSELSMTTDPLDMRLSWRGGAVIDQTAFSLWRVSRSG